MKYAGASVQCLLHRRSIKNVTFDERYPVLDFLKVLALAGGEIVQNDRLVPLAQDVAGQVRTNKTGAAR